MKKILLSSVAAFYSAVLPAQDAEEEATDVNSSIDSNAWYASPWVWVLGAAIFILMLVALTRRGSRNKD